MKNKILNTAILLLSIFTLTISCGKDDNNIELAINEPNNDSIEKEEFNLNIISRGSPFTSFVLITDEIGNRYIDTSGLSGVNEFKFEINKGAHINVTIGSAKDDWFSIITYMNVDSGSYVSSGAKWTPHECFNTFSGYDVTPAKLKIKDIDQPFKLITGFMDEGNPEFEPNEIVLDGNIVIERDIQIVIQETINSIPKSMIIGYNEWQLNSELVMEHSISFNDFIETNKHVIKTNTNQNWLLDVSACTWQGSIVDLDRWTFWPSTQEGDSIIIHLDRSLIPESIKFQISNLNFERLSYSWIHNNVPSTINFPEELFPNFVYKSLDSFLIESTFDFNLNVADFRFDNDIDNRWQVISQGGTNVGFKMPRLPSEILQEFPFITQKMNVSSKIYNHMIKTEFPLLSITEFDLAYTHHQINPDHNFYLKMEEVEIE